MKRADPLRHLEDELGDLREKGLLRLPPEELNEPKTPDNAPLLVLCSNDYLGYASERAGRAPSGAERGAGQSSAPVGAAWPNAPMGAAWSNAPMGAGASRLVSGDHEQHRRAERAIADWLCTQAALLFSSGYAANVGTIQALAHPGDHIVSDALNHASIIDGCRLSGAHITVVPHNDVRAVEEALRSWSNTVSAQRGRPRRQWVVTESYFSMDGDVPQLRTLRQLCDTYDAALYVDEAHALGALGPYGRGLCAEQAVVPDVFVGTLGKAVGLHGAFVAGSRTLRRYLWNRARSFVFSTGLSPAMAALIQSNVERVAADDAARSRLAANVRRLQDGLARLGVSVAPGKMGPVLPWIVGAPAAAVAFSKALRSRGVLVQAIRPPTVPFGTARLRITATAALTERDIDRALRAFQDVAG
ncbi:MAG: 8-amino-7-oxononanoate synthase [Polyangiaceae bacterium]|nr:8-amino-7-oxononanoate synthase [Polyangiaceae bacterium]